MAELDENTVTRLRKTTERPPKVSVTDAICVVTGKKPRASLMVLDRLCETHNEVSESCVFFKFQGLRQQETPVTDAVGITLILWLLPGKATAAVRRAAAKVVVQYLGGYLSVVDEITANRGVQSLYSVGPAIDGNTGFVPTATYVDPRSVRLLQSDHDNPAVLGQSAQGPTPHEIDIAKHSRMQALGSAFQLAQSIESTSLGKLRVAAQKAIDDVLLPEGDAIDQFVDAATILRERAHTEEQIARLAGELGRDLKLVAVDEERITPSNEKQFGDDRKQVGLYHRIKDAGLIAAVLVSFKDRKLYKSVMEGEPDPIASRRVMLLDSHGRGRSRSQRH
jgi:hypothetical protein